ncbi:MAG: hypothetical protein BWY82_03017 [Verrucomicrobia bacterium ADurb.Bin474]|nr:MAG: hypothetical protein BWY82_03017 [Verrucomicrobia bacterium ADurb.Bin474]
MKVIVLFDRVQKNRAMAMRKVRNPSRQHTSHDRTGNTFQYRSIELPIRNTNAIPQAVRLLFHPKAVFANFLKRAGKIRIKFVGTPGSPERQKLIANTVPIVGVGRIARILSPRDTGLQHPLAKLHFAQTQQQTHMSASIGHDVHRLRNQKGLWGSSHGKPHQEGFESIVSMMGSQQHAHSTGLQHPVQCPQTMPTQTILTETPGILRSIGLNSIHHNRYSEGHRHPFDKYLIPIRETPAGRMIEMQHR